MEKRVLLLIAALICFISVRAQFYESGQDPASFRWSQMKTPHFNLVYPDTCEPIARRLSHRLEAGYEKSAYSLNVSPKRISVLLHPSSVFSNAFVAWAPKRMEFVTTPPQDNDAQDWNDQLAIHEYRHLVQLTSVNRGMTKVLSWFFGEQITAGVMGAFVPFWFIEGDATLTETLLSGAGRGRLPSFDVALRAQLIEKGAYHYDKAVFGSYKDFVPDHYVLGYHLVTTARREYGARIWEQALRKAGTCPIMITPFNHEIRKNSGLSKVKLYRKSMNFLDSVWRNELQAQIRIPENRISPGHRSYTSYRQPVIFEDTSVIALRSGMDEVRKVVRVNRSGKVQPLFRTGSMSGYSLSSAKGKIMWAEAGYDPRWDNRNYSNIWIYDTGRHRKKKLSHRSRSFAPSIAPDGLKYVTVAVDLANKNTLEIRDPSDGRLIRKKEFPSGTQLMTPSWSSGGDGIVLVLLSQDRKYLAVVDSGLRSIRTFRPADLKEMTCPVMFKDQIYFSSARNNIDNIFVYDTLSGKTCQVSSTTFGAYEPVLSGDGKRIVFSAYTADGFVLTEIPNEPSLWRIVDPEEPELPRLFEPLLQQETGPVSDSDSTNNYPSRRYHKFPHLLNPHSWGPLSVNADRQTVRPGLTVMSQNLLTTLTGTAGWEYDLMQQTGTWFADLSFSQWYPIIDLKFSIGNRSSLDPARDSNNRYSWTETSLRTSVRLPLNLSSGPWIRTMQFRLSSTFYSIDRVKNYPENGFKGYIRTMDYQFYWNSQRSASLKDIEPRCGQMLILDYRHTPFDGLMMGRQWAVRTAVYFPGIGRHHTFYLNASFQQNTSKPFKYSDLIAYARGIRDAYDDQFYTLSGNYTLPLLYPDLHCGSLFYLKRIWMNAFLDHTTGSYAGTANLYSSAGAEIYADIHFLRFLAPFRLGFRGSWLIQQQRFVPEFLYTLNLSGIQ